MECGGKQCRILSIESERCVDGRSITLNRPLCWFVRFAQLYLFSGSVCRPEERRGFDVRLWIPSSMLKEFLYFEKWVQRAVNLAREKSKIMSSHVCRPEERRGFDISYWIRFPLMCRNFCALRRDLRVVNITLKHLETMSSHVCRPEETRGFDIIRKMCWWKIYYTKSSAMLICTFCTTIFICRKRMSPWREEGLWRKIMDTFPLC